jgi:hypothetical protein
MDDSSSSSWQTRLARVAEEFDAQVDELRAKHESRHASDTIENDRARASNEHTWWQLANEKMQWQLAQLKAKHKEAYEALQLEHAAEKKALFGELASLDEARAAEAAETARLSALVRTQREETQRISMHRALRFAMHRDVARGWAQWHSQWTERATALESMRRSLGHLLHRQAWRALAAWRETAGAQREHLRKLRLGVGRMLHRRLSGGLIQWRSRTLATLAMTRAIGHLLHRSHSLAWHAWVSFATTRADGMRKLTRGISRLLNRQLAAGWATWVEVTHEHSEALRKLRHGAGRFLHRLLSVCVTTWRDAAYSRAANNKALRFLLNSGLTNGWVRWQEVWAERTASLASMRRSVGHMLHRERSRAFAEWAMMALQRAELVQKMRKGLAFLVNRALAAGFASWCDAKPPPCAARALAFLLNRGLAKAWTRWQEKWTERATALESMRRSLGHLLHRQVSRGWAKLTGRLREAREEKRLQDEKLEAIVREQLRRQRLVVSVPPADLDWRGAPICGPHLPVSTPPSELERLLKLRRPTVSTSSRERGNLQYHTEREARARELAELEVSNRPEILWQRANEMRAEAQAEAERRRAQHVFALSPIHLPSPNTGTAVVAAKAEVVRGVPRTAAAAGGGGGYSPLENHPALTVRVPRLPFVGDHMTAAHAVEAVPFPALA